MKGGDGGDSSKNFSASHTGYARAAAASGLEILSITGVVEAPAKRVSAPGVSSSESQTTVMASAAGFCRYGSTRNWASAATTPMVRLGTSQYRKCERNGATLSLQVLGC